MIKLPRFLKSSVKFISKVLHRSLYAAVLLILHASNLYINHIKPSMPPSWIPTTDAIMGFLNIFSFWISIFIVILAILYTFYEVDKEVREPKTTKKLKEFYLELGDLLIKNVSSDEELQSLKSDYENKIKTLSKWMKENMDQTSLRRINQQGQSSITNFTTQQNDSFNYEHSQLINKIIGAQERILVLIERPIWI